MSFLGKWVCAYAISNVASFCHFDGSAPSFYPFSKHRHGVLRHGSSFTVEAKKGTNNDTKNGESAWFPEAVLLKKKKRREDGRFLPDFADDEEEKLYEKLTLDLQNTVDVKAMRHYETIYMIHEDRVSELEAVREMVREFISEKKGKIWKEGDWGVRVLAYKIKRAKKAHYLTMNVELESKWVNEFKNMLEKDERVIRYLVVRRHSPSPQHCLPPPDPNEKVIPRGYKAMIPEDWGDDDDEDDDEDSGHNDVEDDDNDFEK